MMYSIVPLVAFLVAVQAETLDDVIAELARRQEMNSTIQMRTGNENSCLIEGKEGVCVSYYLCSAEGTILTDGQKVIDLRVDSVCESYLEQCCLPKDRRPARDKPNPEVHHSKTGCGWRNPNGIGFRIAGAEAKESEFAEFPWMVAVFRPSSYASLYRYLSGGSLIHPSIVLTAAHSVYNYTEETLRIRAGDWDTSTTREEYPYQERNVSEIVIHPQYSESAGNNFNDIALLFLSSPVELAPNVRPACLPPRNSPPRHGARCFVTGWGKDNFNKGKYQVIMKKVEVPIKGFQRCQRALRKTRLGAYFELHESFVCAGGAGRDACTGDGGSPLVCPSAEAGRYIQHGIVSWGIGCAGDPPGVYTNVARFREWVDGHVTSRSYDTAVYTL